jgi:hypothetical protein
LLPRIVTDKGCLCRPEGAFDPLADYIFLAAGAMQVDLTQDTSAVAGPRGDLRGRPLAFSHSDRAACRRP